MADGKITTKKPDLTKLSEYLKNQKEQNVYLSIGEIESIIGCPLPDNAKKEPHWWYNNVHSSRAQTWLANNYRTTNVNQIPYNEYLCFQRFGSSFVEKVRYNKRVRWIIDLIVIPFLIMLIGIPISVNIAEARNANEKIQIIESGISLNDIDSVEDTVYSVTPYLERHGDYTGLCKYYTTILEDHYNDFTDNEYLQDDKCFKGLNELGQRCLMYAQKADSIISSIAINNTIGNAYSIMYKKTLDVSLANTALEFYRRS